MSKPHYDKGSRRRAAFGAGSHTIYGMAGFSERIRLALEPSRPPRVRTMEQMTREERRAIADRWGCRLPEDT